MATLAVNQVNRVGVDITLAAVAAGGDKFPNDGRCIILVDNANVTLDRTISAAITKQVDGVTPDPKTMTATHLKMRSFGPFPPSEYNDADENVALTYSASGADLTIAVVRL
jgi:hypothetical protein